MKNWKNLPITIATLGALFSSTGFASGSTEEGYFVFDSQHRYLNHFNNGELSIDHMNSEGYEVYGPRGLGNYLDQIQVRFEVLEENEKDLAGFGYPEPEEVFSRLRILANENADIVKAFSIGISSTGRELFVLKISDNVEVDEKEPEFKYIGNMHGNEIVGRDMLVLFAEDLIKRYRAGEQQVVEVINNTELYIMPTMNPDGSSIKRRGNDHWKDLNRNFPDFTTSDNTNTSEGREPETEAVMKWQASRQFSLSANFHGGSKVVNYPWDTTADPAPLTEMIKEISLLYASTVPGFYDNTRFSQGVTNGYQWYHLDGGMQDWSYFWHNDLQVTIELSNVKWPNYSEIPQYYQDNSEALLAYLSKIHQGAGFYLSQSQKSGRVQILKETKEEVGSFGFERGEFYKVLPEGMYTFKVDLEDGTHFEFTRAVSDQQSFPLVPNYEKL
ncbi:unnamed protein product [Chrysoparadoxa australica]